MSPERQPIERMDDEDRPFREVRADEPEAAKLDLLYLSPDSTAADVRDAAGRIKGQYLHGIVEQDTQDALEWALGRTGDCIDNQELMRYLLFGWSFKEINWGRNK